MIKKPSRKSLRQLEVKADWLFQEKFVKENPKCIVCGQLTNNGHHVIYKSKSNALRYDEKNMAPLCMQCHMRHHYSGDPYILATIIAKRGRVWFDDLQLRRRVICKFNKSYLREIIDRLEERL